MPKNRISARMTDATAEWEAANAPFENLTPDDRLTVLRKLGYDGIVLKRPTGKMTHFHVNCPNRRYSNSRCHARSGTSLINLKPGKTHCGLCHRSSTLPALINDALA